MSLVPASTDRRLVERSCQGDDSAFDALVVRHKRRVFNLVYRMTGDREWSEDITVDVFLEAYLSLARFRQRAKFSTWLHRIAVNVCLEHIRRQKAKAHLAEVPLEDRQLVASSAPADAAITNALAGQVMDAMQTLPEAQRAAIVMFYLEDRSCAEIAEILGVPRNTVKTRIFYGTRVLRDQLQAEGALYRPA